MHDAGLVPSSPKFPPAAMLTLMVSTADAALVLGGQLAGRLARRPKGSR